MRKNYPERHSSSRPSSPEDKGSSCPCSLTSRSIRVLVLSSSLCWDKFTQSHFFDYPKYKLIINMSLYKKARKGKFMPTE